MSNHALDEKNLPSQYFEELTETPLLNHLDSINGWARKQDFKRVVKMIGNVSPLYVGSKYAEHMNGLGFTKCSLLPTDGSAGIMSVYNFTVYHNAAKIVLCDADLRKTRAKDLAKNRATPKMRFEEGFMKLNGRCDGKPTDTAAAAAQFRRIIGAESNAYLRKQAYFFLGLMTKTSAFQTGDANKYRQAIDYFDSAWQVPTAAFLEDGAKLRATSSGVYNYFSVLVSDNYAQLLQLALVQEQAQTHYLLAEVSHDQILYKRGATYYYLFAEELTKKD